MAQWPPPLNTLLLSAKNTSLTFFQPSSRDKRRNEGKNSINCLIQLNENEWMFEKGVKTRNQRTIFKL